MGYDIDETDEAIIEVLSQKGNLNPSGIADEIGTTRQTVHTRLQQMIAADYVEKVSRGIYSLQQNPLDDTPN